MRGLIEKDPSSGDANKTNARAKSTLLVVFAFLSCFFRHFAFCAEEAAAIRRRTAASHLGWEGRTPTQRIFARNVPKGIGIGDDLQQQHVAVEVGGGIAP